MIKENGMTTLLEISKEKDMFRLHNVLLNDGDSITIPTYVANGIIMIYNELKQINKKIMDTMNILELLNIYTQAIKDEIITEPKMKVIN